MSAFNPRRCASPTFVSSDTLTPTEATPHTPRGSTTTTRSNSLANGRIFRRFSTGTLSRVSLNSPLTTLEHLPTAEIHPHTPHTPGAGSTDNVPVFRFEKYEEEKATLIRKRSNSKEHAVNLQNQVFLLRMQVEEKHSEKIQLQCVLADKIETLNILTEKLQAGQATAAILKIQNEDLKKQVASLQAAIRQLSAQVSEKEMEYDQAKRGSQTLVHGYVRLVMEREDMLTDLFMDFDRKNSLEDPRMVPQVARAAN
eukprot:comp12209_c0_seq1/m.6976 comp12209_c0_seq1/g.6976  ORF comp12209_c0_seq1/g.6976 comp12209_c0_seq1/m.6976 type:complete len:255 (-) comp12209_c0_seq1:86-850(-)